MLQGSLLGPLLLNIYLNDLFVFQKDVAICSFTSDTTTYISDESSEDGLKSLEKNFMLAIHLFENKFIKLNTDKCHLIVSGNKHKEAWTYIRIFNVGK